MKLTNVYAIDNTESAYGPALSVLSDGNLYIAWTDLNHDLNMSKLDFDSDNRPLLYIPTTFKNVKSNYAPSMTCDSAPGSFPDTHKDYIAWGDQTGKITAFKLAIDAGEISAFENIVTPIITNTGTPSLCETVIVTHPSVMSI